MPREDPDEFVVPVGVVEADAAPAAGPVVVIDHREQGHGTETRRPAP